MTHPPTLGGGTPSFWGVLGAYISIIIIQRV